MANHVDTQSPSIILCKDKIIKYSNHCIIYYDGIMVYKQYPLNKYRWVNELGIVRYLNETPNNRIIKFVNCEIIDDYVIDVKNKEICLDKKEKMVRLSMNKYNATLDNLSHFNDREVFFIVNNLLASVLFCKSKGVMHRDLKERNVFINYQDYSPTTQKKKNRRRIISEIVLADFNTSKYNYNSVKQRGDIMTATHRPPEVWTSMEINHQISYDDRVDVWSFCIILTFLLTNKSFYGFLSNSYLKLDPTILYNVDKLKIVLDHFLLLFTRKRLKHADFYKKIVYMGIKSYNTRCTFDDIKSELIAYNVDVNISVMTPVTHCKSIPLLKSPDITLNSLWINRLHEYTQNNDIVLSVFYTNMPYVYKKLRSVNRHMLLAMYLLITYIINDNYQNIDTFVKKIQYVSNKHKLLRNGDDNTSDLSQISTDQINSSVSKLLRITEYVIIHI
jgi:serine/threonine protein kinase